MILSREDPLAQRDALALADLKNIPLITLNTENQSQARLLECLQKYGLTVDSVLGDADWELTVDLLRQGFVSFMRARRAPCPKIF